MYGSVCDGMDHSVVYPDIGPTVESLLLREHVRKILRKLCRPKADA